MQRVAEACAPGSNLGVCARGRLAEAEARARRTRRAPSARVARDGRQRQEPGCPKRQARRRTPVASVTRVRSPTRQRPPIEFQRNQTQFRHRPRTCLPSIIFRIFVRIYDATGALALASLLALSSRHEVSVLRT